MSVSSDSYEAKVSAALVQMLADCATFWALVDVAPSSASALSYIVEDDGGEQHLAVDGNAINIAGSWGVVRLGDTRRVDRAFQTWGYEGDFSVFLLIRAEDNDTPSEAMRRARNIAGQIAAEMQALVGASASRLPYATFDLGDVALTEETGALHDGYMAHIAGTWRDIP